MRFHFKRIDITIFYAVNEFLNGLIKFILYSSFNGFDFPTLLSMSYYLRGVSEHFHTINVHMAFYWMINIRLYETIWLIPLLLYKLKSPWPSCRNVSFCACEVMDPIDSVTTPIVVTAVIISDMPIDVCKG